MFTLIEQLKRVPRVLWAYFAALLALLYGFASIATEVLDDERILFDRSLLALFERHRSATPDVVADVLNIMGGLYVLLPLVLLLTLILWRHHRRSGLFLALAGGGAMVLNGLAKLAFERARPDRFEALVAAPGYSFPSGHTMASTAVALALFFIVRFHRPRWQGLALLLALLFAGAVGASRSYLQVHYPSDVTAGWLLSAAWVLGVNSWYARARR